MSAVTKIFKGFIPFGIVEAYEKTRGSRIGGLYRDRTDPWAPAGEATKSIARIWVENQYYEDAEDPKWVETFWGEDRVFVKRFSTLNCSRIVELACGHGRHVPHYLSKADEITLIDINRENIDFCKKRFENETKIKYLVGSGNNFNGIETGSQTAVFSYDAMVHFEMLDVIEYLKETYRVLENGGKFLFHHSNAAFSPELSCEGKPHGRNFMSADVFACVALRLGFTILSQDVFSWSTGKGYQKNLDCLTLCVKIEK